MVLDGVQLYQEEKTPAQVFSCKPSETLRRPMLRRPTMQNMLERMPEWNEPK